MLSIRYGVVANIIASHAIARGSIPSVGIFFALVLYNVSLVHQLNVPIAVETDVGNEL